MHSLSPVDEAAFHQLDTDMVALSKTVLHALVCVEFDLPELAPGGINAVSIPTLTSWLPEMGAKDWLDIVRLPR